MTAKVYADQRLAADRDTLVPLGRVATPEDRAAAVIDFTNTQPIGIRMLHRLLNLTDDNVVEITTTLFDTFDFDAGKRFGAVVPDNAILGAILALKEAEPGVPVVFVSKDINLRIKATIYGIASEDYENDRALDDFKLMGADDSRAVLARLEAAVDVALDAAGNIYTAEATLRGVTKYVRK